MYLCGNYPAAAANRSLRCAYRNSLGSTRVRLDLCQLFCEWLKQPSYKQKMCGDLILNIIQKRSCGVTEWFMGLYRSHHSETLTTTVSWCFCLFLLRYCSPLKSPCSFHILCLHIEDFCLEMNSVFKTAMFHCALVIMSLLMHHFLYAMFTFMFLHVHTHRKSML